MDKKTMDHPYKSPSWADRLNFFEPLRFISALAIACFLHFKDHLAPTFGVDMPFIDNKIVWILSTKSAVCVQLFFLMSGILFYFQYAEKIKNGNISLYSFAQKRIVRVYPVLFVTTIICYFLYLLLFWKSGGEDVWRGSVSIWWFVRSLLFCGWTGAPNGPTWYIFILLLVSFIAFFIVKKQLYNFWLLSGILAAVILQERNVTGMAYYITRGIMGFFLGILIAQLLKRLERLPANKRAFLVGGNLFVFLVMLAVMGNASNYDALVGENWYAYATFLLWPPLLIAGYFMPMLNWLCGNKLIKYLGKISFGIYLWNFPILAGLYTMNRFELIHIDITTPSFMAFLIVLHLLIAMISREVLEKWAVREFMGLFSKTEYDSKIKSSEKIGDKLKKIDISKQENIKPKLRQNKRELFSLLASSAFATSIFCFFGPIQLYIANISEMWFTIGNVFWPSMVTFLLLWMGCTAFGILLYYKTRLFPGYICILCGLGLALYVQGNLLPMDYGILNGATVDWGDYQNKALLNMLLWIVLLALPFVLMQFLPRWSGRIISYLSCGLILVQVITTGTLCIVTDFSKSAVTDVYLSNKGLYEVSSDKNVVIFILDTFDKRFFENVYNEEPSIVDFMDGFTYFENMTSAYPNTRPSLPYILTGQYYLNEQPYTDYIIDAWENCTDYYQLLSDAGFSTNIYTEDRFISSRAKLKWISNAENDNVIVSSYIKLEKALLQFTSMRFFPDGMKKYVWSSTDPFLELKKSKNPESSLFNESTAIFMKGLLENQLSLTEEKQYHFIHLDGTHMPYTLQADCTEITDSYTSASDEVRGCLAMLQEYIRQLKEYGVYDDTCIIITGDHGFSDVSKTSPVLFVKGINQSGEMQISSVPVSHENMMGTVIKEICESKDEDYGRSVFNMDSSSTEMRKFYFYTQNDSYDRNYMPAMVEYNILPENNNVESFILTGKTYTDNGVIESEPYAYRVGEPIVFQNSEALSYFISGTPGYVENDGVWSSGHHGRACFHTGSINEDLLCHIQLGSYVQNDVQRVIISSGGQILYNDAITSNLSYINFLVPKESVIDGMLILDFDYPDACSSFSLGKSNEDMRDVAIKFWEIAFQFSKATESINFANGGNAEEHYVAGWHGMESASSWSNETASIVAILPERTDIMMSITYWTHPGAKDTSVYYNGQFVGILSHHNEAEQVPETILLPAEYRSDSDAQLITFVTDGATTSKEYYGGDVQDNRVLGIAVAEINFE